MREIPANDVRIRFGVGADDAYTRSNLKWIDAMADGIWSAMQRGYDVYFESEHAPPQEALADDHTVALIAVHHGNNAEQGLATFRGRAFTPDDAATLAKQRRQPLALVVWAQCHGGVSDNAYRTALGADRFENLAGRGPIFAGTIETWMGKNLSDATERLPDLRASGARRGHLFDRGNWSPTVESKQQLLERLRLLRAIETGSSVYFAEQACTSLNNPPAEDVGRTMVAGNRAAPEDAFGGTVARAATPTVQPRARSGQPSGGASLVAVRSAQARNANPLSDALATALKRAYQRDKLPDTTTDSHRCAAAASLAAVALAGPQSLKRGLAGVKADIEKRVAEADGWLKQAEENTLSGAAARPFLFALQRMQCRTRAPLGALLGELGFTRAVTPGSGIGLRMEFLGTDVSKVVLDNGVHRQALDCGKGLELMADTQDQRLEWYQPPAGSQWNVQAIVQDVQRFAGETIPRNMQGQLFDEPYPMPQGRLYFALAAASGRLPELAARLKADLVALRVRAEELSTMLDRGEVSPETLQRAQDLCMLASMQQPFGMDKENQRQLLAMLGVDVPAAEALQVLPLAGRSARATAQEDLFLQHVAGFESVPRGHALAFGDGHAKMFVHLANGERYLFDSLGVGEMDAGTSAKPPCLVKITSSSFAQARATNPTGPLASYVRSSQSTFMFPIPAEDP